MNAASIKLGKFYTIRTGEVVMVKEVLPKTQRLNVYKAWEQDGQEPIYVSSKDILAEALEPVYVPTWEETAEFEVVP